MTKKGSHTLIPVIVTFILLNCSLTSCSDPPVKEEGSVIVQDVHETEQQPEQEQAPQEQEPEKEEPINENVETAKEILM